MKKYDKFYTRSIKNIFQKYSRIWNIIYISEQDYWFNNNWTENYLLSSHYVKMLFLLSGWYYALQNCPGDINHPVKMHYHSSDVIMSAMGSQLTGISIVCSNVCSGADQRKLQSSVSLAFVRGIRRWPVHSPHKGLVTRKILTFDDVTKENSSAYIWFETYHQMHTLSPILRWKLTYFFFQTLSRTNL